jgi:hypothetical protein
VLSRPPVSSAILIRFGKHSETSKRSYSRSCEFAQSCNYVWCPAANDGRGPGMNNFALCVTIAAALYVGLRWAMRWNFPPDT